MPGLAIQPGLPITAAPAVRTASGMADEHFSRALDEKPKATTSDTRTPSSAGKDDADGNDGKLDGTPSCRSGQDGEAARPATAGKGHDDNDQDAEKDRDDKDGGALPPHMQAERVLAQPWPTAAPATNGPAAAAEGGTGADATSPDGNATGQGNGAAITSGQVSPATVDSPVPDPELGKAAGMLADLPTAAAAGSSATPTTNSKSPGVTPPAPSAAPVPSAPDPAPDISVIVPAGTQDPSPSAVFMAKVASLDRPGQSAPQAVPASAPASAANVQGTIPTAADQQAGDAGSDPNGKGEGDGGAQGKAAQNAPAVAAGAKADSAASPLPTAQLVPSSGSANSFVAALADGGRLARYASAAAAAVATGAPAGSLPVQSLSIQLRPVELGTVTANLKYSGSGLTIDIQVETPDAQRRLSSDSSDIVKSLQSLGFQIDKVTVRQVQPQVQAQGQPQAQSTARDGSAGGFAGQGGAFSMSGQSERQAGQNRQGSGNGYEDASDRGGIGMVQTASDRLPGRGVFI
ncbi:MAG: flagellar hook-length control protein FliK [Rhizobiaceae bacterium]